MRNFNSNDDDIILLSARYINLKSKELKGVLYNEENVVELAKIRASLLELLKKY